MKKATLISLFLAILTVISLVSCNTANDPIPDETSSEITTDEVTTEEETTEGAVTLDPNWVNDTTPATYRYLEGLPNEKWYLDCTPNEQEIENILNLETDENIPQPYVVKTPLRYETEVDGIVFRIEFFEETHHVNEMFQYRLTMINTNDTNACLYTHIYEAPLLSVCDAEGETYYMRVSVNIPWGGEVFLSPVDREAVLGTVGKEYCCYTFAPGETIVSERIALWKNKWNNASDTQLDFSREDEVIYFAFRSGNRTENPTFITFEVPVDVKDDVEKE